MTARHAALLCAAALLCPAGAQAAVVDVIEGAVPVMRTRGPNTVVVHAVVPGATLVVRPVKAEIRRGDATVVIDTLRDSWPACTFPACQRVELERGFVDVRIADHRALVAVIPLTNYRRRIVLSPKTDTAASSTLLFDVVETFTATLADAHGSVYAGSISRRWVKSMRRVEDGLRAVTSMEARWLIVAPGSRPRTYRSLAYSGVGSARWTWRQGRWRLDHLLRDGVAYVVARAADGSSCFTTARADAARDDSYLPYKLFGVWLKANVTDATARGAFHRDARGARIRLRTGEYRKPVVNSTIVETNARLEPVHALIRLSTPEWPNPPGWRDEYWTTVPATAPLPPAPPVSALCASGVTAAGQ